MTAKTKPKLVTEAPEPEETKLVTEASDPEETISIAKPRGFLDRFRAKRSVTIPGVKTLLTPYPIQKMSDIHDFVRLHPDKDMYWTWDPPLCFVAPRNPGQTQDLLHLIDEDLAGTLPHKLVKRWGLALAATPDDGFFLCTLPTQNLDDTWNATYLQGCDLATQKWTMSVSRRPEGKEGYKAEFADDDDAFPPPEWPTYSLEDIIETTFHGRTITSADDPGYKRLRGRKLLSK